MATQIDRLASRSRTLAVCERARLKRSARGHRPGTPAMTNLCAHRELRRSVEIPNTQWALYPTGGGISAGGAVITAWFFTAPFITAHVDASD